MFVCLRERPRVSARQNSRMSNSGLFYLQKYKSAAHLHSAWKEEELCFSEDAVSAFSFLVHFESLNALLLKKKTDWSKCHITLVETHENPNLAKYD